MYGYLAFYRGKKLEVRANTIYEAQQLAAKQFKAKHSYDVTVVLCENPDGSTVIHKAVD